MVMLGVITDKRGFSGEMLVTELIAEKIELPENIVVNIGYSPNFTRKYNLNYWKSGKRTAKCRLDGINSDEHTKSLMEMGIFVDEEILKSYNSDTTFSHELVGLKVLNALNNEEIGIVKEILMLPANDVVVIERETTLLNLPLVEEFINDINITKGLMKVILPDGYEVLEEPK